MIKGLRRRNGLRSSGVSGIMEPDSMTDTIFTAPEYNPARERRNKIIIIVLICLVIVAAAAVWWFRYWPQEHIVNRFFDAIEAKDYKAAYGIWQHDPQWEQHQDKYAQYPFNDFYRDWGPSGDWGLVK